MRASEEVKKSGTRVFGVALFAFLALSGICGGWGILNLKHAVCSRGWPQAKGEILSSELKGQSRGKDRTRYYTRILYRYTVNNTDYESGKVGFHDAMSTDRKYVKGIVERYPKGKEVTVFYHPKKPGLAVLEPGLTVTIGILGPFIFGIAFLCIALCKIMPQFMRERREAESQSHTGYAQ